MSYKFKSSNRHSIGNIISVVDDESYLISIPVVVEKEVKNRVETKSEKELEKGVEKEVDSRNLMCIHVYEGEFEFIYNV